MERGNFIVIAIVVAAIALFTMRFFSESPEDAQLAGLSASDRAGHPVAGSSLGSYGDNSDGRGASRAGGPAGGMGAGGSRTGSHGGSLGGAGGGAGARGGSGSAVIGGGARAGGSV